MEYLLIDLGLMHEDGSMVEEPGSPRQPKAPAWRHLGPSGVNMMSMSLGDECE